MKKVYAVLAIIILSLVMAMNCLAGWTVKPFVARRIGTGTFWGTFCNAKMFNAYSPTIGDTIGIYNAKGIDIPGPSYLRANELEFEIGISTNTKSEPIYMGTDGVDFTNGIYIASSNPNSVVTGIIDY